MPLLGKPEEFSVIELLMAQPEINVNYFKTLVRGQA